MKTNLLKFKKLVTYTGLISVSPFWYKDKNGVIRDQGSSIVFGTSSDSEVFKQKTIKTQSRERTHLEEINNFNKKLFFN